MNRAMIIITSQAERDKATRWAQGVPLGTRVEWKETKRSLPQNDRFWAMLTDIAEVMKERGRDYSPNNWKVIFMSAFGHEVKFLPSLDQKSFIPVGHSSSDLSVREMSDLMEFMGAWAAENDIVLNDHKNTDGEATGSSSVTDAAPAGEDASQSSPATNEPDRELLIKTCRLLWAARGPDPDVIDRQATMLKDDYASANEATKKKAGTIKAQIKKAGTGEIEDGEVIKYIASVIGVEPKDLVTTE